MKRKQTEDCMLLVKRRSKREWQELLRRVEISQTGT